jgi:hypothetical protein
LALRASTWGARVCAALAAGASLDALLAGALAEVGVVAGDVGAAADDARSGSALSAGWGEPVAPPASAPSGPAPLPPVLVSSDPRSPAAPGAAPPRPALTAAATEARRGTGPADAQAVEAGAHGRADGHQVDALEGTVAAGPPADAGRAGPGRCFQPRQRRAPTARTQ